MKKLFWATLASLALVSFSGCVTMSSSSSTVRINLSDPVVYDTYFTKAFNQPVDVCYDAIVRVYGNVNSEDILTKTSARKLKTERYNPLMKAIGIKSAMGREIELQFDYSVYGDDQSCVIRANNLKVWINQEEQKYYDYVVSESNDWGKGYAKEMNAMNQENGRPANAVEIPLSSITYSYRD